MTFNLLSVIDFAPDAGDGAADRLVALLAERGPALPGVKSSAAGLTLPRALNGGQVLWPRIVDRIEPQDFSTGEGTVTNAHTRIRDELGVSPRGALALFRAVQARALLSGRSYASPDRRATNCRDYTVTRLS